ncbi:MAG: serine hydrolase [Chitinophagaceae bacterium]|nr:serine hydrolase [Chitinophagaceae bacterium]
MHLKKFFSRLLLLLVVFIIVFVAGYFYLSLPLISAFGAKTLCSSIYLQHRNPDTVIKEDLSGFPFSLATYNVSNTDSSVSVNVFGFAEKKAIFRKRLGATLINDFSETAIRKQEFNIPSPPPVADSIYWPNGNKLADSIMPDREKQQLDEILQQEIYGHTHKPTTTRAIVVVHNGKLVAEKYAPGFSDSTVMPAWSVNKSITGCLIGILVKQGKLNIDTPAPVPQWAGTQKSSITLIQLLQQTSGLAYSENYLYPSEATNMLFKKGNMAGYAESLPLKFPPGTVFNYSSGNSNILSDIIKRTVGENGYTSFPYRELLYKIGMNSATLEPDASGMYVGSSYCYATARDFAKFGLFCMRNGRWNNEQLLPEYWMSLSTQPSVADAHQQYGAQFWLNGFNKPGSKQHQFPDLPSDMYYADGYGGQGIFIIPSRKTIIVRLGLKETDANKLLAAILSALP